MKKVLIIGTGMDVIHLKHCLEIVSNDGVEIVGDKKLKMSFEFLGAAAKNTQQAIDELLKTMTEAKFDQSFDPEPSRFFSKPKNNFKRR